MYHGWYICQKDICCAAAKKFVCTRLAEGHEGEVGTGPTGLCRTLPPALAHHTGAMVLGHGVFTTGRQDFNEAFRTLLDIERASREEVLRRLGIGEG